MARVRLLMGVLVALLAIPGWALAGGQVLPSFDELPSEVEAGASYDLTYTVLQHGVNPVDVGQSEVRVSHGPRFRLAPEPCLRLRPLCLWTGCSPSPWITPAGAR